MTGTAALWAMLAGAAAVLAAIVTAVVIAACLVTARVTDAIRAARGPRPAPWVQLPGSRGRRRGERRPGR